MKTLSPELWAAYHATHYQVGNGAAGFTLRIGVYSPELNALLESAVHDCAAFITACNPYSQLCSAQQNQQLQQSLKRELELGGHDLLEGRGVDPSGAWPGEASLLVPGMGLDAARQTGRRFHQNAIVWAGADAIPRLVLLAD